LHSCAFQPLFLTVGLLFPGKTVIIISMIVNNKEYRTVWMEGREVKMINQHLLPFRFEIISMVDYRQTAESIRNMTVRGAPAIGAAAAYGLVQAALAADDAAFDSCIKSAYDTLKNTRPTARNLFFALDRILSVIEASGTPGEARERACSEAEALVEEGINACRMIGMHGLELIRDGMTILTHCNAGWLACVDWGTALAPVYMAARKGFNLTVLADETRPRCQGSYLTAWELMQEGINVEIIVDNAAGHYLRTGQVDLCIVGTDRAAANGDIANKIGTYEKAVIAKENGIPFYAAVPLSTFDLSCATGNDIPIEERSPGEVLTIPGMDSDGNLSEVSIAPAGAHARNPAFDVTPAQYLSGIITENGIIQADRTSIATLFADLKDAG
jgi:S-methyl-5-thioribose-1-phosphate isomerase